MSLAQKKRVLIKKNVPILKQSRNILSDVSLNPHVNFIPSLLSEIVLLEALFM